MTQLISRAFAGLGVLLAVVGCRASTALDATARISPGPKTAGVAQRVIPRGSLTTAVIVMPGGDRLRIVLGDVHAALELPLRVDTVGAIADRHPGIRVEDAERAIVDLGDWRSGARLDAVALRPV